MATNIKIKKIVKNSKMKRFQWKWIFTGSKTVSENLVGQNRSEKKRKIIIIIITRYDYNLTIMKSPKPATDNRFKK
jgi:hypothetical protein